MKPEDDELDADLKRVLSHDPGEGYFRDFASRVADRIAADARAEAVRAEATRAPWWRGLLSSPRALAAVGGVAVVAVAAGIAFNVMRHPAEGLAPQVSALRPPVEAEAPAAGAMADKAIPTAEPLAQSSPPAATTPAPESDAIAGARPTAITAAPGAPAHMQEVRTNEAGDAVPVPNARDERLRERMAAAAPATPAPGFTEMKRQAQGPLAASTDAKAEVRRASPPAAPPAMAKSTAESMVRADQAAPQRAPDTEAPTRQESAVTPAPSGFTSRGGMTPAPTGEAGALADPRSLGASGSTTGSVVQGIDRALKARGRSPFAGEAPAVQSRVEDAEARTTDAKRAQTPASWDAAASSWGALASAMSTPSAQVEARWRAADARVRAWRAQPSPAREAAAREAVDAFRAVSPRDPRLRGLSGPALPWGR